MCLHFGATAIYFVFKNPHPMELMMYLGNDFIESVPLNLTKISEPGYLGSFKRMLKQRYLELIRETSQHPEFYIINTAAATAQS